METYSESVGIDMFDWNEFLNRTNQTPNQWSEILELAYDWVTCACGNQCSKIPRDWRGVPNDTTLSMLGGAFANRIENAYHYCRRGDLEKMDDYRKDAIKILNAIEKRSLELLQEIKETKI